MKRLVMSALIALVLLVNLLPLSSAFADQPLKVDKNNPVSATDVELAQKVTVFDTPRAGASARPAPSKPAKSSETATGILGAQCTGDRYAIVIGISDYPGTGSDLMYSDNDAQDMALALTSIYGFSEANVITFIDSEGTEAGGDSLVATRSNILSAIETIAATATSDDEVVFFFSGHGGRGRASDGDKEATDECIWSHDGSNFVPIWDGELNAAFSNYLTSRIVFIFDSCYSGGMTDLKATNRIVAMASAESSLSYEWSSLGNGEFTYYMIEQGIIYGLADKYDSITGSADVTVEEAFDYAKANRIKNSPTVSDLFINDLLP